MLDDLKNTDVLNKVGGKFKLSALLQKRMAELVQGSRPLIEDTEGMTMIEIALQEIIQDKITVEDQADQSDTSD